MTQDQIDDYLRKSGDDKIPDGTMVENEYGFCCWRQIKDIFVLAAVYGDGKYWEQWTLSKAKELGCVEIVCGTSRKPAAYLKKYGFEIKGYILSRFI